MNETEAKHEIERLRAVIKRAENAGGLTGSGACPWCGRPIAWPDSTKDRGLHHPECLAFTPEGQVR